ncbi:MAG: ThuA domain-containing protein [Planctomycetota bacterium]
MKRRAKLINVVLLVVLCLALFMNIATAAISSQELQKIQAAAPTKAPAVAKQPRKMLVFTLCKGFVHSSIPYVTKALEIMGQRTGVFEIVQSDDMSIFKPENLSQFDAVCFNNTTKLEFNDPALQHSLIDFVKAGKGIVGIHAATDNFYDWPEAAEMMGGLFDGHPWTSGGTWAFRLDSPQHPLNAAFNGEGFKLSDEIYRIKPVSLYENARILISLDMTDPVTAYAKGVKPTDRKLPVSWVRKFGDGRVFYCGIGHNHHIFWNSQVLEHYLAGIQFALGDLDVDSAPCELNIEISEVLLTKIAAYQYGQSREPLTDLTDLIRSASDSSEGLKQIERQLLGLLNSDATLAGKQFICRKLSIIGTEQAVPALYRLLIYPETSDMARYALERIPGTAVDEALLKALPITVGQAKAGVINTLGMRGVREAVPALKILIYRSDQAMAAAAVAALGRIAGPDATQALDQARNRTGGELQQLVLDAYLSCADQFLAEDSLAEASEIYRQMFIAPCECEVKPSIRVAALRGVVVTTKEKATGIIVSILKGDKDSDQVLQSAAVALINEIPGTKIVEALTAELPNLPVASQVQLLSALADRGDSSALPGVVDATKSSESLVRVAALKALMQLGDTSTVNLLARIAASTKGDEQEAARQSLYRLRGPQIDRTIRLSINRAKPEVKVELIRSIARRNVTTAVEAMLKTAEASDSSVQLESFKVLRVIAEPEHLPALIDILIRTQDQLVRSEAERCVAAVARKIPDKGRQADDVLAVLPSVKKPKARFSLLGVLGRIGNTKALGVLQEALQDKAPDVRTAVIRALSEWPTAEPIEELLKIAQTSDNKIHQVLALRGFIRLIGLDSDRPADQAVKMYTQAMELASNISEKRMVLSGLKNVKSYDAMQMAAAYLGDKALQGEAEVAVVEIAWTTTAGSHPQETKKLLKKILEISINESLRTRAQQILSWFE